jgi:hypothetical protein
LFALWLHLGPPPLGVELPLGPSQGALCFTPAPFAPAPTFVLADTFGLGGLLPATSAPWSLTLPGVPALFDAALQGVMVVDPALTFAVTNAVLLRFVPLPSPTIANVQPRAAVAGQLVTITGNNLLAGLQATLAGQPLPVTIVSPQQATFVMPPGVPCNAPLLLANLGGAAAATTVNPTPVLTSVSPSSGTRLGGTTVVIVGQNLVGTQATIGGVPITVTTQTASVIIGTTPPGAVGPAVLRVAHPNGCQATGTFTYL